MTSNRIQGWLSGSSAISRGAALAPAPAFREPFMICYDTLLRGRQVARAAAAARHEGQSHPRLAGGQHSLIGRRRRDRAGLRFREPFMICYDTLLRGRRVARARLLRAMMANHTEGCLAGGTPLSAGGAVLAPAPRFQEPFMIFFDTTLLRGRRVARARLLRAMKVNHTQGWLAGSRMISRGAALVPAPLSGTFYDLLRTSLRGRRVARARLLRAVMANHTQGWLAGGIPLSAGGAALAPVPAFGNLL